jgi:CheY-like chemotaxis protein
MVTDFSFRVVEVGPSVRRAFAGVRPGERLFDHFRIERPAGALDLTRLLERREQIWLRCIEGGGLLRGVVLDQDDRLAFLVNHAPTSLASDAPYQLQMWDFSPADATLDALLSVELQKGLLAETHALMEELARARDAARMSQDDVLGRLTRMGEEVKAPIATALEVLSAAAQDAAAFENASLLQILERSSRAIDALVDAATAATSLRDDDLVDPAALIGEIAAGLDPAFRAKGVSLRFEGSEMTADGLRISRAGLLDLVEAMLRDALARTSKGWVKLVASVRRHGSDRRLVVECLDTSEAQDLSDEGARSLEVRAGRLGGELKIALLQGVGVKCEAALPLIGRPRSEEARRGERPGDEAVLARRKILAATDQTADLRVVEFLADPNSTELVCVDAHEALLDSLAAEAFDLVLIDLQLPSVGGLEALRALRRFERETGRAAVRAHLVCPAALRDHLEFDETLGVEGFVDRPLTPASVRALLAG